MESKHASGFIRPFCQLEPYDQPEPGHAKFHWVLKRDEIPGLQMGLVELKGPMHKTPAAHDAFHQAYLIESGSGVIHLGESAHRVDGPTLVVIPRGTQHSVELQAGEQLRYIFVNQHRE